MIVGHPAQHLVRRGDDAFVLEHEPGGGSLRAEPAPGGWDIGGDDLSAGWFLRREESPGGGFSLRTGGADWEVSRTLALESVGQQRELRYLLMGDGRLFRIALRGPKDSRFELLGWETSGAYLTARPQAEGWRIEPNPASGGIPDIRALSLLFAAEILDSEEPLGTGEPT
jgi:hypothetical protein